MWGLLRLVRAPALQMLQEIGACQKLLLLGRKPWVLGRNMVWLALWPRPCEQAMQLTQVQTHDSQEPWNDTYMLVQATVFLVNTFSATGNNIFHHYYSDKLTTKCNANYWSCQGPELSPVSGLPSPAPFPVRRSRTLGVLLSTGGLAAVTSFQLRDQAYNYVEKTDCIRNHHIVF